MANIECAFCNIYSEPERIIRVGGLFTSFLSRPRLAEGHSLVVPNRHVETITDLTPGEAVDIFAESRRIASKLLGSSALDVQGVDTWTKTRPSMPETEIKVDHMHMHVIPSSPGDELYDTGLMWTPDKFHVLDEDELDKMIAILK